MLLGGFRAINLINLHGNRPMRTMLLSSTVFASKVNISVIWLPGLFDIEFVFFFRIIEFSVNSFSFLAFRKAWITDEQRKNWWNFQVASHSLSYVRRLPSCWMFRVSASVWIPLCPKCRIPSDRTWLQMSNYHAWQYYSIKMEYCRWSWDPIDVVALNCSNKVELFPPYLSFRKNIPNILKNAYMFIYVFGIRTPNRCCSIWSLCLKSVLWNPGWILIVNWGTS